jgi:hypothetical protein
VIGKFHVLSESEESLKKSKEYLEIAKGSFEKDGDEHELDLVAIERCLEIAEEKISGKQPERNAASDLDHLRKRYNRCRENYGQSDLGTIYYGVALAGDLGVAHQTIEAKRLLLKLVASSRRVHGPDHRCTVRAIDRLKAVKKRLVVVASKRKWFEALDDDGEKCVIKALTESGDFDEDGKDTLTVASEDVLFSHGTPVICHGFRLRSKSHLNGKIGDVRNLSKDRTICEVHFEDDALGSMIVKRENLILMFDLPNVEG